MDYFCRAGACFSLCGVTGFVPYTLMDYKHLAGDSADRASEASYDYLINKKITVLLTEVI